jgi:BNR/Asp-box repeat
VTGAHYAAPVSRRGVVAALAVGVVTVTSLNATAAAPVVRNVSRRHANQAEAAVAVNPANPSEIVVASNTEFGYGIVLGVSHDGGQTWSRRIIGDRDRFGRACCDPSVTWSDRGDVFLSWLAYGRRVDPDIVEVVTSADAGGRWSEVAELEPPEPRSLARVAIPGGTPPGLSVAPRRGVRFAGGATGDDDHASDFVDQPTITSGHGELWLIWNHDGWLQASGARIRAGGGVGRFDRIEDVPHSHGCTFGDVAIGASGEVLQVCQRDVVGSSPRRSRLRASIDRDGLRPAKGFTPGFTFATTNVSLFDAIRPQRSRTVDAEVGLAWDTTGGPYQGRVYLVFSDEHPNGSGDLDTFLMTSDDRGATWAKRSAIDTAPRAQFLPRVSLDQTTGSLAVGFHDASLDSGSGLDSTDAIKGDDAMYAITFSADGGATWTAPTFVSEAPSNAAEAENEVEFGDYTGLDFTNGVAHPAWADNSNSTGNNPDGTLHEFDVYSAAVTFP